LFLSMSAHTPEQETSTLSTRHSLSLIPERTPKLHQSSRKRAEARPAQETVSQVESTAKLSSMAAENPRPPPALANQQILFSADQCNTRTKTTSIASGATDEQEILTRDMLPIEEKLD
jgi:hypothetical protein